MAADATPGRRPLFLAEARKLGLLGKAHWTHSESPFVSHRQRKLCKEKPSPRVPSGTSPRPGWRRLAHSVGVQIPSLPPNSRSPDSRNFIPPFYPTAIARAPFSTQPSRRDERPVASPRDGSATFASLICARAGDGPKNCSAQRSLSARLGRDLTMAAAATPRGRPQYAASRDEIAPSASGDREPTQPPGSAQRALTARLGKSNR